MRGSVDARNAERLDLYPTLANLAGAEISSSRPGLDLFSDARRPYSTSTYYGSGFEPAPAIEARMFRTPEWKLITYYVIDLNGETPERHTEFYRLCWRSSRMGECDRRSRVR